MRRTAAIRLVKGLAMAVPQTPPPQEARPGRPLRPGLEEAARRRAERLKEARRTRLHFFGLAGGRR